MPSEFARNWTLDPSVTFLNRRSFAATPRPGSTRGAAYYATLLEGGLPAVLAAPAD